MFTRYITLQVYRLVTTLFCSGFLCLLCIAQPGIEGTVSEAKGKKIARASVELLSAKDSSLVKGSLTDGDGNYFFKNIRPGQYLVSSSYTGFEKAFSSLIQFDGKKNFVVPALHLTEFSKELKAITVQAKKPPFEQKIDRMVVNVQSTITAAGSTALDVLERSPGIIVDRQNNAIIMGGKEGVVIMINGKINRMPADAVVQLLSGMSANNIEKIELITTPPSNFDAEGNAGYINIVFKTNPDFGTNGSYTLTMGYGRGETPAGSINFNHRKGKVSLFGDYSYARTHLIQNWEFYRQVSYQSKVTDHFLDTDRDAVRQNHNARLGMDYQLSKKTTLGGLMAAYTTNWAMNAVNDSRYIVNQVPDTTVRIINDEINNWQHFMSNINMQHSLRVNEKITFDLDYLYYRNNNPVDYSNSYYNGTGNFVYDDKTKSGKVTPIQIWVGKLDYVKTLGKKVDLEAGLKATISRFKNDVMVERQLQSVWSKDEEFSANYALKEDITAAYGALNIGAGKNTSLKLGLRYEYTTSNLGTEKQVNIVDRKYGNLFPSFFVAQKLSDISSINFSYSRRITRPTFNELAPWVIFFDPNTFISGNAALQPSIANSVKWDYMLRRNIVSLAYTHENDIIVRFQPKVDAATNKQTLISENLDSRKTVAATLALPVNFYSWWTMQLSIIGLWQQQNALYNGDQIKIELKNYRLTASQNFTLPKDYSLELSGFYQSASFVGFSIIKPYGALNFGVQKKLIKNSGSLRFNVTDIFNTIKFRGYVDQPKHNLVSTRVMQFVPRTFTLTYTKNFGSKQLKARKARSTGSDEERKRVE